MENKISGEFGSDFPIEKKSDYYFKKIENLFTDFVYLRSGREGLGFIADQLGPGKIILLPAYCCRSMIMPFTKKGWMVRFYSLNEDFSVNVESVDKIINENWNIVAILLMNYYGVSLTNETSAYLKRLYPDLNIIEDITHCLFDLISLKNENIDYYVASIRKWMGIADGAVVLSKHVLMNKPVFVMNNYILLRLDALEQKLKYNYSNIVDFKQKYKTKIKLAENLLEQNMEIYSISDSSYKIVQGVNSELINMKRQYNFKHLSASLSDSLKMNLIIRNVSEYQTPFCFPVLVDDRNQIQKQFSEHGLYAPCLWAIDPAARAVCKFSAGISDHILAIPIDQRYNYYDIENIARIIKTTIG